MDSRSVYKVNEKASLSGSNGESRQSHLHMDPELYEAAAMGNVEPFQDISEDEIESLVTPGKNTILHTNITSPNETTVSTNFVKEIIEICPSLLLKVNARGDTPLHVAAQRGHADIVRVLIESAKDQHHDEPESGVPVAKQMIGMLNNQRNTALHEAICCRSLDIVKILMKEEPDFPYSANDYGETPLYMAVARSSSKVVAEILEDCPSAAHDGPGGKTTLHAAVIDRSRDIMVQILKKNKSLTRERDQYGWTPLHYAAYFGWKYIIVQLLEFDRSAACIVDKDRKMTALHLAAARGHADIVNRIIEYCPECYDLVDDRGWNFLHFAMLSLHSRCLHDLLEKPLVRNLINVKDVKGNTPLHVLAVFCRDYCSYICFLGRYQADYEAVNKQCMSVNNIIRYGFPEFQQEIRELAKDVNSGQYPDGFIQIIEDKWKLKSDETYSFWKELDQNAIGIKEAAEYHLVVAALIATVTFAAGFTLPGGYRGEEGPKQGTAILSRNTAFQAFVVTDAIATILSLSAVFIHFLMSLKYFKELVFLFVFALLFTMIAMVTMVIAFITGTFAVLSPSVRLAIPTFYIGLSFFPLMFFLCYKACSYPRWEKKNIRR